MDSGLTNNAVIMEPEVMADVGKGFLLVPGNIMAIKWNNILWGKS